MSYVSSVVRADSAKPFRLVRYFGATSMILILIFAVSFSWAMARWSRDVLLESYREYARILATNLNHQVFRQFVLPTATLYGQIELSSEFQQRRLDRVVRQTIHSLNIDQVNIYDVGGILVYSTEDRELGVLGQSGPDFESAAAGRRVAGLVSDSSLFDYIFHQGLTKPVTLRTLAPFRARDLAASIGSIPVLGVFELNIDLTKEMEQIYRLQVLVALAAVGLMAVLITILVLIVRKGEQILTARADEQKRLEVRLQETERMAALGRMVASVSHEIKTPLGIIRSSGELLGSQMNEDEPSRKLTGVIVEECTRLNRIVTEFLDFARPQKPNLRPCRMEEILQRNLEAMAPELDRQGITLESDLTPGPEKPLDPDLLYRAFLNILVNAIQAMPGGGTLSVKSRPLKEGRWLVQIADTGPGIPEDDRERVFEPFYTAKEKGSGLGLSIVKSILDAHDGRIEIGSSPEGGTKIMITI